MSLQPLWDATFAIQLHAICAIIAFFLALIQFALPKGTLPHRFLGWIWVLLLLIIAVSSFWIHQIDQWNGFSLIHLLSIYVLVGLVTSVYAARNHNVMSHKRQMIGIFVGGLLIAGAFTFMPGRIMNKVVTTKTAPVTHSLESPRQ